MISRGSIITNSKEVPYCTMPLLSHKGTANRYCSYSECRCCFDSMSASTMECKKCKCGLVYCNIDCYNNDNDINHHHMVCKCSDSLICSYIKFAENHNDVFKFGLLLLQKMVVSSKRSLSLSSSSTLSSLIDLEMKQFEKDFTVDDSAIIALTKRKRGDDDVDDEIAESFVLLHVLLTRSSYWPQYDFSLTIDRWKRLLISIEYHIITISIENDMVVSARLLPTFSTYEERKSMYDRIISRLGMNTTDEFEYTVQDEDQLHHIEDCLPSSTLSEAEIERLVNERKVCKLSSFASSRSHNNKNPFDDYAFACSCLFKKLSKTQHSCLPNVHVEATNDRISLSAHFIAMNDIMANDTLTRSVVDYIGFNRQSRVEQLQQQAFLYQRAPCLCLRCSFEELGIETFLQQIRDDNNINLAMIRYIADLSILEYDEVGLILYKTLLEIDDSVLNAYTLGSALIELGRWTEARSVFRQAIAPHDSDLQSMIKSIDMYVSFNSNDENNSLAPLPDPFLRINLINKRKDLKKVYVSKAAVFSETDCEFVIREAEICASVGWTNNRHKAYPTSDIPLYNCSNVLVLFNKTLQEKIFPMLASIYQCESIHVHDAFIVKYSSDNEKIQRHLPHHFDQSTHSLTIALNSHGDEFRGGGTVFGSSDNALAISPSRGKMVAFAGKDVYHGGDVLLSGQRYILAVFLIITPPKPVSVSQPINSNLTEEEKSFSFNFTL